MPTSAVIGSGATVQVETSAGAAAYTALVGVLGVTPPATAIDSIDGTQMDSGRDREFVPGLRDPGEMQITLHHVQSSATDDFIEAWIAASEKRSVILTYGNTQTVTASAFPTNYAPGELTPEGKHTATLTLKVSGSKTRS